MTAIIYRTFKESNNRCDTAARHLDRIQRSNMLGKFQLKNKKKVIIFYFTDTRKFKDRCVGMTHRLIYLRIALYGELIYTLKSQVFSNPCLF